MKQIFFKIIIFYIFIQFVSITAKGDTIKLRNINHFSCRADTLHIDTIRHIKTVYEFIRQVNFRGVIIVDGKRVANNNPFLNKPVKNDVIKQITILRKVSIDSVRKYGNDAQCGMLLIKTK